MRNKPELLLALLVALAIAAPAAIADEESSSVESPAEALKKAEPTKKKSSRLRFDDFSSGTYQTTSPADELSEPVPVGTRTDFERRGWAVVTEDNVEILVDESGQIYIDRLYQGIIPGLRNELRVGEHKRHSKRHLVMWVGFQPMAALQRFYWLLSHHNQRFEVIRLSDRRIEVFFPGAAPHHPNDIRPLVTQFFTGPVARVDGKRVRGGTRYIIELKKEANYLYRWEPPFLYLDFEK